MDVSVNIGQQVLTYVGCNGTLHSDTLDPLGCLKKVPAKNFVKAADNINDGLPVFHPLTVALHFGPVGNLRKMEKEKGKGEGKKEKGKGREKEEKEKGKGEGEEEKKNPGHQERLKVVIAEGDGKGNENEKEN